MIKTKEEIRANIEALKQEYMQAAQVDFKAGAATLFGDYPELQSFGWRQYTPYFNDGDECTFSAHTDDPEINGFDEYDRDEGQGDGGVNIYRGASQRIGWPETDNPNYNARFAAVAKAVKAFLKQFDEDSLKEMFGDHIEVKVTAGGVETEECSHD
jgi:hypothetical protein